ncbi:hypothetical protein COLO4_20728 [Corchorus olitorius]|uniref:DNA-directed RNA polymerase n=1 Tax=Corchorus olitorius TaxID=93759 RepID=A0A1R3IXD2_9ROSI|nr:hypothetical protein COLO4_20728 [Corchorus olitorius]
MSDQGPRIFKREHSDMSISSFVDSDGLPHVGQVIHQDEPYCSTIDQVTNSKYIYRRKGSETVIVDYVAVDTKNKNLQKANIRFRHPRNPVIGDKFSSRHGQKGVCSQLWPDIDMPFSGITGMSPDLIINPHAFPSRMTIGMLLEILAAKGGCLHGNFVDATPFSDDTESESLVEDLGSKLRALGFNYHGTEVRATGQVDQITRQPIKGRKRGGGVRFGEMERDSLLAHGAAYLLHDRLHVCSDYHVADVCSLCGSLLTTTTIQPPKRVIREFGGLPPTKALKKVKCLACQTSKGMETVAMPYVFKYLVAELAAMNIKMTIQLNSRAAA